MQKINPKKSLLNIQHSSKMSKFYYLLFSINLIFLASLNSDYLMPKEEFEYMVPTTHYPESRFFNSILQTNSTPDPIRLPNTQNSQNFSTSLNSTHLDIDSTSQLNLSLYTCKPVTFGYSKQDGKRVFPDFEYPDCASVTGVEEFLMKFDEKTNKFSLKCPNGLTGYAFVGPAPGNSLMKKGNVGVLEFKKIQEIESNGAEFALGACLDEKDLQREKGKIDWSKLQHGAMRPVFNKELFDHSRKKVKDKPVVIVLLTLDSLSRRHFYRKLPSVIKFLNETKKKANKFSVYDFKLHSTFGSDSVRNQMPIFGGKDYRFILDPFEDDTLGHNSMWAQMKSKGFITFMGLDDCDKWFPRMMGENIKIDYSVRQFYCLVDKYLGIRTEKNETEQRCLGPKQTHFYILNYTLQLLNMYKGANFWISLHLNAGHEKTGQHAATLDKDLNEFLNKFLQIIDGTSEVFMFLGADHGMRYGHWYNTIDSHQETKLPAMFLLASNSLLERFPFAYHCLKENSERLTSKLDLRKTLLSLIQEDEFEPASINLLTEIASYSRSCEDLDSNLLYCACSPLSEITSHNDTLSSIISLIQYKSETYINLQSHFNPQHPAGTYCDYIKLNKIIKFYHMGVDSDLEIFKLEFGSSDFPSFKLEVNAFISSNAYKIDFKHKSTFPPFNFASDRFRYRIRVICD